MNEWISIKDRLPKDPEPSYNWVPVTDGKSKWSIARYGHLSVNDKLIESWEFFDDVTEAGCPYAGDAVNIMTIEEITYWIDIWKNMRMDES